MTFIYGLILTTCSYATDVEVKTALALAASSQSKVAVVKTCACSGNCVCGCNVTGLCTCRTVSAPKVVYFVQPPVPVTRVIYQSTVMPQFYFRQNHFGNCFGRG